MTETLCDRCGAFGDIPHGWIEGDCVLPHRGHAKAAVGHVCQGCVDRHRDWLREIVDLYATLPEVVAIGSIPDDTAQHKHQRKRPASPALVRLDAWAMLNDRDRLYRTGDDTDLPDVPAVIADHAQRLYDDLGLGDAPDTLTGAAATLTARADDIARSPWVDEYDADLAWVRKALRRAHGTNAARPVGRCPSQDGWGRECGGPLWPDPNGSMAVDCARCRRHFDERFLSHLGGMIA